MSLISPRSWRYLRLLIAGALLWLNSGKLEKHLGRGIVPLDSSGHVRVYSAAKKARGRHIYRNGLVEVNPEGPHPIFELMKRAEEEWSEKLRKASSSLDEAIGEYRRRYRRNPPKGFDKWWAYVQAHDVQLPDEYDQIDHDLRPFFGLEPSYLIELQTEREAKEDTYTLGKNSEGKIDVLRTTCRENVRPHVVYNANLMLDVLRDVEDDLPSFRAVFSPHDSPSLVTDYLIKTTLLEAADTNSYIGKEQLPERHRIGWRSSCHPDSPARKIELDLDGPPPSKPKKTFIYNHQQTMDPCQHPRLFWRHGQFLSHNKGPDPYPTMIPEFSSCTTFLHHNIRVPTPYGWVDEKQLADDPDFEDKIDERLLWRGTNTGAYHAPQMRWQNSHRDTLVRISNEVNGSIEYLVPPKPGYEDYPVGEPQIARKSRFNPSMMDTSFVREPTQCDEAVCNHMKNIYEYKKHQGAKEASNYKYVLDIDGNGWSGRFKRLITSNSLIFKSSIYPEWFADRIAPWIHYVPVQVDLSDLYDTLIFFRGDPNGEGAHEDLARQIALQGREWSKKFWRREDLVAYFFRLMLEYARLMSVDREAMTYNGEGMEEPVQKWTKNKIPVEDALLH
ncbi:hypothetical protein D9757_003999 [Collybiopsis confluens]|uniref:Glycosyl transferase CAP10 domain-containing protein n=1 Tax=Collybiopsis confluens TaxID=2823264 RepID=A0A8H5HX38_9AGAR|nr:hypothetical protein D9757_003999 [Collybiopsis confluens]